VSLLLALCCAPLLQLCQESKQRPEYFITLSLLLQVLGLGGLTMMSTAAIIGSGIFVLTGAAHTPSPCKYCAA
jgi:hypothetical protein